MHGIFSCFALIAYNGHYNVAKVDVKLCPFATQEGTLYTKLKKALYGCIQSSHLWYV
jgi:hypothetical protein